MREECGRRVSSHRENKLLAEKAECEGGDAKGEESQEAKAPVEEGGQMNGQGARKTCGRVWAHEKNVCGKNGGLMGHSEMLQGENLCIKKKKRECEENGRVCTSLLQEGKGLKGSMNNEVADWPQSSTPQRTKML